MTDKSYSLPNEVLVRAAEAQYADVSRRFRDAVSWNRAPKANRDAAIANLRAALPVLVPAIREQLVRELRDEFRAANLTDQLTEMQDEHWWEGGMVAEWHPSVEGTRESCLAAVALSKVTGVWFYPSCGGGYDGPVECDTEVFPIADWTPGHHDWDRQHPAAEGDNTNG